METIVKNGLVQPRLYQVADTNITSKQASEPFAVTSISGALTGYNKVTLDVANKKFTFTGHDGIGMSKSKTPDGLPYFFSNLSVENVMGKVVNSHITVSGLVSIDSSVIEATVPELSYELEDPGSYDIICLTARLVSPPAGEPVTVNPVFQAFSIKSILGETEVHIPLLLETQNLPNLRNIFSTAFSDKYNKNTDVIIGIYQIGFNDAMVSEYPEFYEGGDTSDVISAIPYHSQWPPNIGYSVNDVMEFKRLKNSIEGIQIGTLNLIDGSVTNPKIASNAVQGHNLGFGVSLTHILFAKVKINGGIPINSLKIGIEVSTMSPGFIQGGIEDPYKSTNVVSENPSTRILGFVPCTSVEGSREVYLMCPYVLDNTAAVHLILHWDSNEAADIGTGTPILVKYETAGYTNTRPATLTKSYIHDYVQTMDISQVIDSESKDTSIRSSYFDIELSLQ